MNLIIVESPTKARTLSRFLGKDYKIEATMGHLKDLPKSKLSVEIEKNFNPLYAVVVKKQETIDKILAAAKKAKKIYLASDPDREGEAISAHVDEILNEKGIKSTSRIVFHEITKEAINEALDHPRGIDRNLVDAQIARRVLDRLVGYTLSPLLWKKVRRGLSAGRVQSVAVRLIVEKEREIVKFEKVEYWEIFCKVKPSYASNSFIVQLIKIDNKKASVSNKSESEEIVANLKKATYIVSDVRKREIVKNPYPPFTTSTMTRAAANIFGWSAKKTMSTAQVLYEEGLITYHRTDSVNLSKTALFQASNYIKKNFGDNYLFGEGRFYKTKSKVAQEAHEAIRPTQVNTEPNSDIGVTGKFAPEARKLYELIWRRFLACQMASSLFDETTIDVKAQPNQLPKNYLLRASGQVMKFEGWRRAEPARNTDALDKEFVSELPSVAKDENLDLVNIDPRQKFTQPPARFNEASLIKTLEALGIGRPSTYAPIISTIQVRQYVQKDEGKFKPAPVGVAVTDFLVQYFPDVVDYSFTKEMEDELDEVAKGDLDWHKMMGDFYKPYDKKLNHVTEKSKRVKIATEQLGEKCPKCKDGELVIRIGRFGKFISCSNFPECDYKAKYMEKIGMKCPKCKEGDVIVKKAKWKKFFGCSRYPDCDFASWKNPKLQEYAS